MRVCTTSNEHRPSRAARREAFRLALALLLATTICTAPACAKTLQWKLDAGQRLLFVVERTVHQKSPTTDWTETIRYQVIWSVTERDADNRIRLVQTLTEVKHALQFPGAPPIVYDSMSDGEPRGDAAELARYWKPLLQVERSQVLLPRGQLVPPEATPTPQPTSPAATPAGAGTAPAAVTTSRPVPSRPLADVYWLLPIDDLSLGDSWAETQTVSWRDIPDAVKVTTSYTYQGEEEVGQHRLDKIAVQARWDLQPMPTLVRQISLERQSGTGVIYFDAEAGFLSRSDYQQDLVLRIGQPQVEPMQAEISTTLKVRCQPVIPAPDAAESEQPGQATP
jgi:hypothetical protein